MHCSRTTALLLAALAWGGLSVPATAEAPTLARAILEDMLPSTSSKCAEGGTGGGGETQLEFNFTTAPSTAQCKSEGTWSQLTSRCWDETAVKYEDDLFLAQISHKEANANRSWTIRVSTAGNMYSFVGPFGEAVPPQYHVDGPFVDEVWQSVMVHNAKNNQPPLNKKNFIHQAGAYYKDCTTADGVHCNNPETAGDYPAGDYMRRPYFSPSVARHCEGRQCSFASWGTQAHVPTPFTSGALYMNKYTDCGDGVLEFTQLVYNFGADRFDYSNMPWGGVRRSVFQDLRVSQSNGAERHEDADYPMQHWGQTSPPSYMPLLKDTGGYVTFAENLVCETCTAFSMPCGNGAKQVVDCASANSIQLSLVFKGCSESADHTSSRGQLTIRCSLAATVDLGGAGCSGCTLDFTNAETGAIIPVKGVLHWSWQGASIYFFPDSSVSDVQAAFPNPSTVTVSRADRGKAPEENLALSYVMGVNAEQQVSGHNGLNYVSVNHGPRIRYGTGGSMRRDYLVWTMNPYVDIEQGDTYAVRHYMITDKYAGIGARASEWVSEVSQRQRAAGQLPGRSVTLYSADNATFGATVNGSTCAAADAVQVCSGSTTPQDSAQPPLFAITCGSQRYVGSDLYHFAPLRSSDSDAIRAYVCRDQDASVRPSIDLLGWFPDGACAALQDAAYQEAYCVAPTPPAVDEVQMIVQLPYTVHGFTSSVQDKFKAGVASVLHVNSSNVVINSIAAAATAPQRRLLGAGVIVDFSVRVPAVTGIDKSAPMQMALSEVEVINEALAREGVAAITAVVQAPVAVSATSGEGAAGDVGEPGARSLTATRDFTRFSRCSEERTWPSVRHLLRDGAAKTGGLGPLMTWEHQVRARHVCSACLCRLAIHVTLAHGRSTFASRGMDAWQMWAPRR